MKTLKLKPWFYAYSTFHWLDQLPGKLLWKIKKKTFLENWFVTEMVCLHIVFFHLYHLYPHLHLFLHLYLYELLFLFVYLFSFSLHWEVISIFKNSIFQGLVFGGGASPLLLWLEKNHTFHLWFHLLTERRIELFHQMLWIFLGGEKAFVFKALKNIKTCSQAKKK